MGHMAIPSWRIRVPFNIYSFGHKLVGCSIISVTIRFSFIDTSLFVLPKHGLDGMMGHSLLQVTRVFYGFLNR